MNVRPLATLWVALSLAGAGCRGCKRDSPPTKMSDAAPSDRVSERSLEVAPAKLLGVPEWTAERDPGGFGLPVGCRAELPIHRAALPEHARFFTANGALAWLALGTGHGDRVEARALVDLESRRTGDLPWQDLDHPPLVERATGAWVAALAVGEQDQPKSALVWREGGRALEIARGDRLEIADFTCRGNRCAVLTTLARAAVAPGALLITGDPRSSDDWRRVPIETDPPTPWQPLSIVRFDSDSTEVALASGRSVALWKIAGEKSEKLGEAAVLFGAWDVVRTPAPLVIAPGARPDGGCNVDEFPLSLAVIGGASHDLTVGVAPEGVIARPLDKGALVAWVAPVSCRVKERPIVHLLRVDERGAPRGAPMAVADASGFALATAGNRVSLWLRTKLDMIWIRGVCE